MTRIAIQDIFISPGVRAFRAGDSVPDSVVDNLGIQDKVASPRAKSAQAAVKEARKEG